MRRLLVCALIVSSAACARHNGRSEGSHTFDRFRNATNNTRPIVQPGDVNRAKSATNTGPIVKSDDVARTKDATNTNVP